MYAQDDRAKMRLVVQHCWDIQSQVPTSSSPSSSDSDSDEEEGFLVRSETHLNSLASILCTPPRSDQRFDISPEEQRTSTDARSCFTLFRTVLQSIAMPVQERIGTWIEPVGHKARTL